MQRIYWVIVALALSLIGGCIDTGTEMGKQCRAEDFCAPGMQPVCGADGKTYACAPLAQCFEVRINPTADACQPGPNTCPELICDAVTCDGERKLDENGCPTCECIPQGCDTASCSNYCEYGYKENDCDGTTCECNEPPQSCMDDPCVVSYCGTSIPRCARLSELMDGACPPLDVDRPEPICQCGEDECDLRRCNSDFNCMIDERRGLCVTHEGDPRQNYCIAGTCDDLKRPYQVLDPGFTSCTTDDDCTVASEPLRCCGGLYVNQRGAEYFRKADEFIKQTSCYEAARRECQESGIACGPMAPPSCVQGVCGYAP